MFSLFASLASRFLKFLVIFHMTADFLCIWYSAGNELLNEGSPSNMAQPLPWNKEEDSLESLPLMSIQDNMVGKKKVFDQEYQKKSDQAIIHV